MSPFFLFWLPDTQLLPRSVVLARRPSASVGDFLTDSLRLFGSPPRWQQATTCRGTWSKREAAGRRSAPPLPRSGVGGSATGARELRAGVAELVLDLATQEHDGR